MRPVVLTVAGSDSSGGAGIQADIKTIEANGGYAATVVTAITAQNTRGVLATRALDPEIVAAQLDAVLSDLDVRAVKSGMLVNSELIAVAAAALRRYSRVPFVCDPVLHAGSGEPLLVPAALAILKRELIPLSALITPNLPEAESLTGRTILTERDAAAAGRQMIDDGARAVLITGGHLAHGPANDYLLVDDELIVIEGERIEAPHHHGSGCTLASAIATQLARGLELVDAIHVAKRFVSAALRFGLAIGTGTGPVDPAFGMHRRTNENARGADGDAGDENA